MRIIVFLFYLSYALQGCSQQKNSSQINNTSDSTSSIMFKKPSPGKLFVKAENAYQEGYYKETIELCNQIITLDSNYTEAFYLRGKTKYRLGNYRSSIKDFNIVIYRNPDYNDAYVSRGGGYQVLGEYQAALKDFNHVINRNPNDRRPYYNRALIYELRNEMQKACADWRKAAKLGDDAAAAEVEKNCK